MALPKVGDGQQVGDGNTDETLNVGRSGQAVQIGLAAATLVGFHGATPVAQATAITTIASGTAATTATYGAPTPDIATLFTAVNAILTVLHNKGITG